MKKLKYLWLAFLVALLLAIPATAQNEKVERSNNGAGINNGAGKLKGKARAEQVQNENKKGENIPSKGSKSQHKHNGWSKNGKHFAKGHS